MQIRSRTVPFGFRKKESFRGARFHGPGKIKTLRAFALDFFHLRQLSSRLNTFGNHFHPKIVRKRSNGFDDFAPLLIGSNSRNERAVYL